MIVVLATIAVLLGGLLAGLSIDRSLVALANVWALIALLSP